MTARYNALGVGYNRSRRADPGIGATLLRLLGSPGPGTPVLDLGCGTGNYTRLLAGADLAVTGIDPSEVILETARAHPSAVRWVKGSGEALPFAAGTFRGVVSTQTVHHFRDPLAVFKEVRSGISAFRLYSPPGEQRAGLAALRADLDAGHWPEVRATADEAAGDYAFVTARC